MKPQKPEWTVPVPVCLKSLHQPTSITTHTIVMQWGTQFHIGFIYHYNLIHLTSIGDAAALLWSNGYCHMISGGGWWEWGNIQCTVGAYSWPGDEWSRSSVLERAYCPTFAQCPQVGAFRFSFSIPFSFVWNRNSPPSQWRKTEKICSAISINDHSIWILMWQRSLTPAVG